MQTQRATARKPPEMSPPDLGPTDRVALATAVVGHLLVAGKTVSVAESCTGGLIAAALTEIPGASQVFPGGAVAYSDEIKALLLGVPECLIEQHGAVSAEVAAAMACAVAEKFGTDYGLASTGFAGPGGGTESAPVGTVFFGYHSPCGLWACRIQIEGDRAFVRERAVEHALNWMRRKLKKYHVEDTAMAGLCE